MYYSMDIPYKLREAIRFEDLSALVTSDGKIVVTSNMGFSAYMVKDILERKGIRSNVGWALGINGQVCIVDETSL